MVEYFKNGIMGIILALAIGFILKFFSDFREDYIILLSMVIFIFMVLFGTLMDIDKRIWEQGQKEDD